MKLRGEELRGEYRRTVELSRPDGGVWRFAIQPLSLGFSRELRRHGIIPPARPTRVVRDATGKPLRDGQGLAVLAGDDDKGEYQAELERYHQRMAVLMIAEGVRGDPEVEFSSVRPTKEGSWEGYADALIEELETAGFSAGDVGVLCQEIARMSQLLPEHVKGKRDSFPELSEVGFT